ncbi:MAG: hypothetical protein HY744_08960 [Deltaproteobacteria bacterium]|nr:hypothetical protein [Deltaproteobacteria bacterium]
MIAHRSRIHLAVALPRAARWALGAAALAGLASAGACSGSDQQQGPAAAGGAGGET